MKKLLQTIAIIAILTGVQNIAGAYNTNRFINMNHLAYNYNYKKLLAYSNNPIDNVFVTPEINQDLSVAKVIDKDFSLEMDLDVNSKKQIKPKANIIPDEKKDNSSKCVQKVMKPHLDKKYKVNNEISEEDVANLDIDKVTDVKDMVKKQKQQRKEKIAKAKTEPKERIGWFSFLKRDKSKTDKIAVRNENLPEIDDIDNVSEAAVSNVETERFKRNANKTKEKIVTSKTEEKPVKVAKVAEPKPEKIKPVKVEKEKPVKVAKVKEEKVVTPKPEKVKPIKVAKVKEEKVITPKAEKEKPVKIAKVEEPKPEKVKPVKVEKEKPMKVAKVEEPKQKKTEIKEEKTTFASKPVIARTEENDLFNIDDVNSNIEGKTKHKVNKEKPVKVVKVTEPKPEKVKPVKVAKVKEEKTVTPKAEKEKPVKIAKFEEPKQEKIKPVKVEKEKPVKVAKVKEEKVVTSKPEKVKPIKVAKIEKPKQEKVKPVKIAKEKPIKVAKFKENSVSVKPQTNNLTINSAIFNTKPAMNNQSQLSILSSNANIFGNVAQKPAKVVKEEKVVTPKVEKEKPIKIAKVEQKTEKIAAKPTEVKTVVTTKQEQIAEKPIKIKSTMVETQEQAEPVEVKPVLTPIPEKEPILTKQEEIKTAFTKKQKQEEIKPLTTAAESERVAINPKEIKTAFTKKSKQVERKAEKEKPVKIAKVEEPKPEKVKPVKVEKEKPIKVAKVKEEKPAKIAKAAESKPEKIAEKPQKEPAFTQIKSDKKQNIANTEEIKNTQTSTPAPEQIAMRPKSDAPELTAKPKQVTENSDEVKNTYTPISDEQLAEEFEEVEEYTPKNEPEQTFVPLTADDDLFSIDEVNSKVEGKVRPRRPVKVTKIKEPKPEKVKPVKVVKEKPVKVAKVKEPASIDQTGVNNNLINNAVFRSAVLPTKQKPLSIMSIGTKPTVVNKPVTPTPATEQIAKRGEDINRINTENKPFTPIKVESKQVVRRTEEVNTFTPTPESKQVVRRTEEVKTYTSTPTPKPSQVAVKPEEVKPFTPIKVESKQVVTKPAEVKPIFTPESKQVVRKTEEMNTFTPEPVKQVARNTEEVNTTFTPTHTPIYKASIPQETPVYNAFETMQSRLPITRKPFDEEL